MAEDIESFRELWSSPDSGWTLHRFVTARHRVFILLDPAAVTVAQLRALRMLPGPHNQVPLRDLKRCIPADGQVCLGEFWGRMVRDVASKAKAQGLPFKVESTTYTSYQVMNRKTGVGRVIAAAGTLRQVAERMMAAGMPVLDAEE